jgi:hypothetical protein
MNISLGIRAFVCRSTTAATSLAEKNPAKYFPFAEKMILAKNSLVDSSMAKAKNEFEKHKLGGSELSEVRNIKAGSLGLSAGASRSASLLMDRYQDHVGCKREINRLEAKQEKYTGLAKALAAVGGKSLGLNAQVKTSEFWGPERRSDVVRHITWKDEGEVANRQKEYMSVNNWKF